MITTTVLVLLVQAFLKLVQKLLFITGKGLCWIVGVLSLIFEELSASHTFGAGSLNEAPLLLRVIFGSTNLNLIFWGLALLGILLCLGFALAAVVRKREKSGKILKNCLRGMALILLMISLISATVSLTATLMDWIDYRVVNALHVEQSYTVYFDSEDYGCMARCLNTIGNYSLNDSCASSYNLNSCYNDIREELKTLADKGLFDVSYHTRRYDENGVSRTVNTWQSVLQSIYRSAEDINEPQPLNEYNAALSEELLQAMDIIRNDAAFEALESYYVDHSGDQLGETVALDRMIMLLGSVKKLEGDGGLTDYLRGPYYFGEKNIFDYDTCDRDFDMSLGQWLYLTVIAAALLFLKEMLTMILQAALRLYELLRLCVSAPTVLVLHLQDEPDRLREWITAFLIQSLGLYGTVLAVRILMLLNPILLSGDLFFFENAKLELFTGVFLMYAALLTGSKASGMLVELLSDHAGAQSEKEASGTLSAAALFTKFPAGKLLSGIQSLFNRRGKKKFDSKEESGAGDARPESSEKKRQKKKRRGGAHSGS